MKVSAGRLEDTAMTSVGGPHLHHGRRGRSHMAAETRAGVSGAQGRAGAAAPQSAARHCLRPRLTDERDDEWARWRRGGGPAIAETGADSKLLLYFIKILQRISSFTRILETVFWCFQQIF